MSISELLIVSCAVNAGVCVCVECLAIQARIELVQKRILNLIYNVEYIRVLISKEVVNTRMFEYSLPKLGQGDLLKNVP